MALKSEYFNPRKCTSFFEKKELSKDSYYSWEAFIKYIAALGNARDTTVGNNVHWADYWDECKPCHFHYDYITHIDQEFFKLTSGDSKVISGQVKNTKRTRIQLCFAKLG